MRFLQFHAVERKHFSNNLIFSGNFKFFFLNMKQIFLIYNNKRNALSVHRLALLQKCLPSQNLPVRCLNGKPRKSQEFF